MKKERDVIFQAVNNHEKTNVRPPKFDPKDQNQYCAYFENDYREQLIFFFDYQSHTGNLWLSKKGWENPLQVVDGKAQGAGLSDAEKLWLKACWHVATSVDRRRVHHQQLLASEEAAAKTNEQNVEHKEIMKRMGHLYDTLAQTDFAPNCSRTEFVYGWSGFIELIDRLEKKYQS